MKFSIKVKKLLEAVGTAQGAVEGNSTIPILQYLLLEAEESGRIIVTGTDCDTTVSAATYADALEKHGAICLNARKLHDLLKILPGGNTIKFETVKNSHDIIAVSEKSRTKFCGAERSGFGERALMSMITCALPSEIFAEFVRHTIFAITEQHSQFTLSGAKLELKGEMVRMVTTDGHRLSLIERKIKGESFPPADVLIPRKALQQVVRMIDRFSKTKPQSEEGEAPPPKLLLSVGLNNATFRLGEVTISARLLSGNFPNYEMIIPKGNDKSVAFDSHEMLAAIKRISLMSSENAGDINLEVLALGIKLTAKCPEEGEASEMIDAVSESDPITLRFQYRYLQQYLEIKTQETNRRVVMSYRDETGQTMFLTERGNGFKHVIMPLRH